MKVSLPELKILEIKMTECPFQQSITTGKAVPRLRAANMIKIRDKSLKVDKQ